MIKTSRQLKDLIRNRTKGDSGKSQLLIRNYAMERFLERITLSKYKDNFILKGGMLVSAMVGLDNRATMDIDTTVRNLPLDTETAEKIVTEIAAAFWTRSKQTPPCGSFGKAIRRKTAMRRVSHGKRSCNLSASSVIAA